MRRLLLLSGLLPAVCLVAACGSGGGSSSGGSSLPAVGHATDTKTAPTVSAGASPAPTELKTKDLVVGGGQEATPSSTVTVQYVGASYTDGKVFDSSWQRGQPATFSLAQVIPGFAKGIAGMKVGGRREVVIPPALGYGAAGAPPAVGPNETLVFVIDLVGVQ
ncbi:MAG TPA: FKBP-type peptidyl-prolyl cis-trans isomerase [Acidimicrobiales bacterium]|nr:FKBP-type peptidyl-prolyl cis-trans isomerase [Acidimicrobiales bacterium]